MDGEFTGQCSFSDTGRHHLFPLLTLSPFGFINKQNSRSAANSDAAAVRQRSGRHPGLFCEKWEEFPEMLPPSATDGRHSEQSVGVFRPETSDFPGTFDSSEAVDSEVKKRVKS
jgi:hypothetical protein